MIVPSARASLRGTTPVLSVNTGNRKGSTLTRCGAFFAQPLALVQRFVDEAHVTLLQVAQAAVHELRGLRGRARCEVVALDQRGAQAS